MDRVARPEDRGGKPPRTVLVTGASTGIGRATSLHLAARGYRVLAGVRRDADARELVAQGAGELIPVRLDVTDADDVKVLQERTLARLGDTGLLALVNNAGVYLGGPIEQTSLDAARHLLDVNVLGLIRVSQACLPLLRRTRGRIINVGSILGQFGVPFSSVYCASKFAIRGMTSALRGELRACGVRVVLVEPGSVETPIWSKAGLAGNRPVALHGSADAAYRDAYGRAVSAMEGIARRGIPPERVARAIHRALAARWPRGTYRVGVDARGFPQLARFLTEAQREALVRWQTGA